MGTPRKPERPGSARSLLRDRAAPVRYDVARGLSRHERLIARGAPLPEWASELEPVSAPRGVSAFAKRAWWLGGTLLVSGALWLGVRSTSRVERTDRVSVAQGHAAHVDVSAGATDARRQQTRPPAREPSPIARPRSVDAPLAAEVPSGVLFARGQAGPARVEEPSDLSPADADAPTETALDRPVGPALARTGSARVDAPESSTRDESGARASPTHVDLSAATRVRAGTRGASSRTEPSLARAPRTAGVATTAARKHKPRVRAESPRDAEEMRQLSEAQRLLGPEPVRALRIVREGHVAFRGGYFEQERRYIEVMALFALGRPGEAHAYAAWFLRDYPGGPYRHRVESEMLRVPAR